MYNEFQIEIANLKNSKALAEIKDFLTRFDLTFDGDVEYTILVRHEDKLVGTGSFKGEILRNIAVDEAIQGSGLTSTIISALMQEESRRGRLHYFIFTKPSKAQLFANLGFIEIARAEPYVALLETGFGSVDSYLSEIEKAAAHLPGERAAIVVNCNPFTRGHQALIEKAAGENSAVIVFVVSEDRSLFPYDVRMGLVKAGVKHLPNVVVVPAGKYIISSATFPTYFTREEDKVVAQTRLDITLFAAKIAPRLKITTRYMGQEPYCNVTNTYNEAMMDILPTHNVKVKVIDRVQAGGGVISASTVRDMIRNDDWEGIKKLVPPTTYDYLTSPEAANVLELIRSTRSRH